MEKQDGGDEEQHGDFGFQDFMKMMRIVQNLGGEEFLGETMGRILRARERRDTLTRVEPSSDTYYIENDPVDIEILPGLYSFPGQAEPRTGGTYVYGTVLSVQYDDNRFGDGLYEVLPIVTYDDGEGQDAVRRLSADEVRALITTVFRESRKKFD